MFVSRKESSDVKIEIFLDMDFGSNELTWAVIIVFIVGRHLEWIDTISLKHFPKIPCESIKLIDIVYLILEIGSIKSTRIVVIFKRYLDLNKLIHTVYLKHCPKINFESIKLIDTVHLLFKKHFGHDLIE